MNFKAILTITLVFGVFPLLATGKAQALQGEGCHSTDRSRWLKELDYPYELLTGSRMSRFMAHFYRMTGSRWPGEPDVVAFVGSRQWYGLVFIEFHGNKVQHCFIRARNNSLAQQIIQSF